MLILVFALNCIIWALGPGMLTLLPQHLVRSGATPSMAGAVMAGAYSVLCLGNLAVARFAKPHEIRRYLVTAGLLLPVSCFVMSASSDLPTFSIGVWLMWLGFGIQTPLIRTQTAHLSAKNKIGSNFGMLQAFSGASTLVGALGLGLLTDKYGFHEMLRIMAILTLVVPVLAAFMQPAIQQYSAHESSTDKESGAKTSVSAPPLTLPGFALLLTATALHSVAGYSGRITVPLLMTFQGYSATPTASTIAIGGAVSVPVTFLIGRLTQRVGDSSMLLACYGCMLLSTALLPAAVQLPHFWIIVSLTSISFHAALAVRSTILAKNVVPESLSRFMGQTDAAGFLGGPFGFLCAGAIYQRYGIGGVGLLFTGVMIAALCFLYLALRLIETGRDTG